MNTKLLRQKILDFAIRGKLTDQRKSDGTARDLLTQISDERRKTRDERIGMSSKKSGVILDSSADRTQEKTSLRAKRGNPSAKTIIPLDKSEVPFEIPENWEWVRLGDVFNLQAGKNIATGSIKSEFEEGLFPCYGGNGLRGYVSCYNREGDFPLIGRQGALCGNINRATGKFYATEHAVVVEVPVNVSVSCACYFLTQLNLNQYASSTAQPGLSVAKINEVPIPFPPLAEQQRIVAKIEEAFAEIDAVEKNKELLKTHIKQTRQKILDLAIHGKLVPQNKADEPASVLLERITRDNPHYEKLRLDERRETKDERCIKDKCHSRESGNFLAPISKDEIPFDIPENWVWCRLGNICKASSGKTPSTAKKEFWNGNILWITSKDVKQKYIESTQIRLSELGASTMQKYPPNTMIIVGRSGILQHSLPVAILKKEATVNQDLKALTFVDERIVEFVYVIIKGMEQRLLREYKKAGTTVDNLNFESFLTAPIPLSPLNEQSRIVAKIDELFSTLDQMERNLV